VSDRPDDRPIPRHTYASARKREQTSHGTDNETNAERHQPSLSDAERAAIRRAGAEDARRSRVAQGLPERIEDLATITALAALLSGTRGEESAGEERNPAA
jgi:hypothetical protein